MFSELLSYFVAVNELNVLDSIPCYLTDKWIEQTEELKWTLAVLDRLIKRRKQGRHISFFGREKNTTKNNNCSTR